MKNKDIMDIVNQGRDMEEQLSFIHGGLSCLKEMGLEENYQAYYKIYEELNQKYQKWLDSEVQQ